MTKSDTDESKDHDAPSPVSVEEAVALSTRDVELEPVSLRDIEMILAPGKVPPPMSLAQKEAKAKGDDVQKSPSVPPQRPPIKVRGARPEPPPVPKGPRLPTQSSVIEPPKPPMEPRKIPAPAAQREESATVDLASLLSGAPKSTRPAALSNADVVIGLPRAPKPIPKPPLKRASIPDDGSVTLPKLDAEAKAGGDGTPDDAKPVTGADSGDVPIVDERVAGDEPVGAKTLIDDGPHALEAFLTDDAPSQDAQAATAEGAVEASEPEDATEAAAKPTKLAPKPPRKQPSATPEKPEETEAKDAKEPEPRPSSRPRRSSAPVSATSARPRSVKPVPPPEEKRSRVGIFAAAAVICGGLVVFAATRGDDPVAKPAPSATAARAPTGTPEPTTPPTSTQNPPTEPTASLEPTTSSEPAPTATTTSTVVLTGRLPVPTETTPPTTTTAPTTTTTTTATQTSAPVGTAPFDVGAANAALSGAMGRAAGCKKPGDPSGVAKVSVTFSTSGRVTQAMVAGPPFAGTPTGGCIANAFRSATVPPFTGDKVTVQKTVNIP